MSYVYMTRSFLYITKHDRNYHYFYTEVTIDTF